MVFLFLIFEELHTVIQSGCTVLQFYWQNRVSSKFLHVFANTCISYFVVDFFFSLMVAILMGVR